MMSLPARSSRSLLQWGPAFRLFQKHNSQQLNELAAKANRRPMDFVFHYCDLMDGSIESSVRPFFRDHGLRGLIGAVLFHGAYSPASDGRHIALASLSHPLPF